ncbi:hypothetical protein [Falsiroseomonas sp.]|uniref:hypothetical protein n=1 Tax=Falsiroseomonas sp. TaxID=2870721 RepID=UPI003F6F8CFD
MSATGLLPAWRLAPPSRLAVEPILGIRALRYEGEGRPGALPAIAGLRLQAQGVPGASCSFDPLTGLTFLQELPPGPRRLLLTDPERRYMPAALSVDVPSRFPARPTLGAAPEAAPPLRLSLRLRPSPCRAVPAGMTAVIGRLRDRAGRGIPLGRLECETMLPEGRLRIVTWTDAEGSFALLLAGEATRLDAPPPRPVARALQVSLPRPTLAAALAADFLGALPEGLDRLTPARQEELFVPCPVQPCDAEGQPAETSAGLLPIRPGRTIRWDLVTPH